MTRRDWIIRIIALIVAVSFLATLFAAFIH
jgi:hypothetical protein